MGRPRVPALGLLVALLFLTGCWSRREANDLAVVLALGIDRAESGDLQVTLAIADPVGGPGKGDEELRVDAGGTVLVLAGAPTLADAIWRSQRKIPRQVTLQHSQVIVLGQRMAREGMGEVSDFLLRAHEVRLTSQIVVARGTARDLLTQPLLLESVMPMGLGELTRSRASPRVNLKDFLRALVEPGWDPLAPVVGVVPHPTGERRAPPSEVMIEGAGIFRGDRWVGELTGSELEGAMWLRGQARDQVLTVPCPGNPGRRLSARVQRGLTAVDPVLSGASVRFRVTAWGEVVIADVPCGGVVSEPETLAKVEEALASHVRDAITRALERTQALGADVWNFAQRVRIRYPGAWRDLEPRWPEVFRRAAMEIDVARMTITHTELTR